MSLPKSVTESTILTWNSTYRITNMNKMVLNILGHRVPVIFRKEKNLSDDLDLDGYVFGYYQSVKQEIHLANLGNEQTEKTL